MNHQGFILCVDDQPEVVDMLLMQLENAVGDECAIEVAESAAEALHVLDELEAQGDVLELVITDEIMPGLKGSRFLEIIHDHDPDIMTMMLTGQAGLDDVIYAVNHGHLAKCLKKPWDYDELHQMVRALLDQTRRNRQNKRLSQQVAEEKNKAEAIVHSITDGILVIDRNDHVSLMNAACVNILGISEPELLGKRLLDVLNIKELMLLHIAAANDTDAVVSDEMTLPNPQIPNANLSIIAIAKTLRDKSGAPLGVVTVLRDITREKEVHAMKANFLATISHELRTPLTPIVATFELLAQETLGALNQEQREFIDTSREQSKVLSELIDNLLDLATLEAEDMALQLEPVDCMRVFQEAVEAAQARIQAKELHCSLEIAPDLPPISADKAKILRLCKLLLSNAIKFTREGSLRVIVEHAALTADAESQPGLHLAVIDSGIGMDPSQQMRAFEKFYQADNSITREFRGSGLGLSVCKSIVDAHHGRIWLESEPDQGTTVHCILPITQPSPNSDGHA